MANRRKAPWERRKPRAVPMNDDEYQRARQTAEHHAMSFAEWVRLMLVDACAKSERSRPQVSVSE